MPYTSDDPPIDLPNLPIYSFLFTSPHSPLVKNPECDVRGYTDTATGANLSFLQVRELSAKLSTALSNRGFRAGHVASFFAPNSIWYPVCMFAVLRLGGVVSGASPWYGVEEMRSCLDTVGAEWVFTAGDRVGVVSDAGFEGKIMVMDGGGVEEVTSTIDGEDVVPEWALDGKSNAEVVAFLSFSSGTTGLPKAVMISHANMIATMLQCAPELEADVSCVLAALPFFHIVGLAYSLHMPVHTNTTVYIMPTFSIPLLVHTVSSHKIAEVTLTPSILAQLVRHPLLPRSQPRLHITRFHVGAAPLPKHLISSLSTLFPNAGIKQGYGMTESCGGITSTMRGECAYSNAHTVGRVLRSTSIKIVSPENTNVELPPGSSGEILVRGPQVSLGYLDNPTTTAQVFLHDGWLRTGDIGAVTDSGHLLITERLKDMIKVNEISVAPGELEECLLQHPDVLDAAVVGVRHEVSGEAPRGYVVLRPGADGCGVEGELEEWVRERKVRWKWLRGGVHVVEEIPRGGSGKVLRWVLRESAGKRDGGERARL